MEEELPITCWKIGHEVHGEHGGESVSLCLKKIGIMVVPCNLYIFFYL
jgi:hypothetical protein